jgi:pyruvate,water dikinase
MARAEISGVLFTADPVSGSKASMTGNLVRGLGEKLVSGESNASEFKIARPTRDYEGPDELRPYARELYAYAARLEREFRMPQDIEWAIAGGALYLLQARPITTLSPGDLDTYAINDSLAGDFLWSNTNIGEAMPGAFTPLSWSLLRMLDLEQERVPGHYLFSGNICGQMYTNASIVLSLAPLVGKSPRDLMHFVSDIFSRLPDGMDIPVHPFERWRTIGAYLRRIGRRIVKTIGALLHIGEYRRENPARCRDLSARVKAAPTKEALAALWSELRALNVQSLWSMFAGGSGLALVFTFQRDLTSLVGTEDANAILSRLGEDEGLESVGPVVGISRVMKGTMSRDEYLERYGHRSPHEFEIAKPDPKDDPGWLDERVLELERSKVDTEALLRKQRAQHDDAVRRFEAAHPDSVQWLKKRLRRMSSAARAREAFRSEWTRVFRVNRAFALRAGELLGIGDDVFFLYIDELVRALSGEAVPSPNLPKRKENYQRYVAFPPFPSIIRGRFNPALWLKDKNRRTDYYDPTMKAEASDLDLLKGYAGASGTVEGDVRVLATPEDGASLQPGEILVATTTNIGWTPLFPRAAAIVTDIGAPLSHAAIVARELGIPAVVGCGNATMRLKTGDRVIVNGGQGTVTIVRSPALPIGSTGDSTNNAPH